MTHPQGVDTSASSRDVERTLHDAEDRNRPGPRAADGATTDSAGGGDGEQPVVAVRMNTAQLAALTEIQRHLGGSRSDAVRNAVEIVAKTLSDAARLDTLDQVLGNRLASRRPVTVDVDPAVAHEVRRALDSVAGRYAEQAIALQRVGNDWNLLAKLAAAGTPIDTDALRAIERQLTDISATMARQARTDAKLATKVAAVF